VDPADREEPLELTPEEADAGCTKRVRFLRRIVCDACRGAGCGACRGGFVERDETFDLVVPAGVRSGARISALGKGDQRVGGPSGNRYFVVHLEGDVPAGAHPYRAHPSAGRTTEHVPRMDRSLTSSPAFIVGMMALVVGGAIVALVASAR
jgi:DnaJ-class molecular chaperone